MSKQTEPSIGSARGKSGDSSSFIRSQAHEITDAITAVIINAQVGLHLLHAQSPDLERVRQALDSIANDGKRAGGIAAGLMNKLAANVATDLETRKRSRSFP